MDTTGTDTNNNQNPDSTSRAILCIILILIILALSSCSIGKNVPVSGGLTGYSTADNGYIIYEAEKILVTRRLDNTGTRTLTIRSWGLDGKHFEAEEEFLSERPDLIADLKDGRTVSFNL